MTVQELINKLLKFDLGLEVRVEDERHIFDVDQPLKGEAFMVDESGEKYVCIG